MKSGSLREQIAWALWVLWTGTLPPWFIESRLMELDARLKQLETEGEMKDKEFRALLDLFMCSDPWPVQDDDSHETLRRLLDRKARRHGYEDWVHAYHEFKP